MHFALLNASGARLSTLDVSCNPVFHKSWSYLSPRAPPGFPRAPPHAPGDAPGCPEDPRGCPGDAPGMPQDTGTTPGRSPGQRPADGTPGRRPGNFLGTHFPSKCAQNNTPVEQIRCPGTRHSQSAAVSRSQPQPAVPHKLVSEPHIGTTLLHAPGTKMM